MKALTEAQRTLRDFQARQDDWRIRDWQLSLTDGETITVGLKDNEVGGVYAPPTTRRVVGGSLYVVWHDGQVSRSAVDARFLNQLDGRLKEMRRAAYEEAFIIDMPEDAVPPAVQVYDPAIARLVREDSEPCFHALRKAGGLLNQVRESYDGSVSAAIASLAVSNSRGLDRAVETSSHGFGFSADSVFGVGHRSRRILGLDSVEEQPYPSQRLAPSLP
jgi:PmbA protein